MIIEIWGFLKKNNKKYKNLLKELTKVEDKNIVYFAKYCMPFNNDYYKDILDKGLLPITSYKDFFDDVYKKIKQLRIEIEDNRHNDKASFYRDKELKEKRTEDECRDEIVRRLKDKYQKDINIEREKHEANNRVDINIKSRKNQNWEIQIECKRDDNQEIYTAIENQLIKKYLSSKVKYGIYLIFYFGDKKNKEKFMLKVEESIPNDYKDNIKIICIDLRK